MSIDTASAQTAVGPMPEHLLVLDDPGKAERDYKAIVVREIVEHPRSQQRAIGPSEIGDPCMRKIAHKLLGTPERAQQPNWRATVGTAIHAWLEGGFDHDSVASLAALEDQERWLVETRVTAAYLPELEPLTGQSFLQGSCDLYDRVTATVIDHKTATASRLRSFRKEGPSGTYRIQAHTYGLGWHLRGFRVAAVAICFLPRDGDLSDAYWWSEPWDRAIADAGIERLRGIAVACTTLGAQAPVVLPTADSYCQWCPFFAPGAKDLTRGCPGHEGQATDRADRQLDGLI